MTILIPTSFGNLKFETKTLEQALSHAKSIHNKTDTITDTNVYLTNPANEWERVKQLRIDKPDSLHGCNS